MVLSVSFDHFRYELFFALKIIIKRTFGHINIVENLFKPCTVIPVFCKQHNAPFQQVFTQMIISSWLYHIE